MILGDDGGSGVEVGFRRDKYDVLNCIFFYLANRTLGVDFVDFFIAHSNDEPQVSH